MSDKASPNPITPRRKTMTPAAIEANRRNAEKAKASPRNGRPGPPPELKEMLRLHGPDFAQELIKIALTCPNASTRVQAIALALDRGWGRAPQPHDGDGQGGPITFQIVTHAQLFDGDTITVTPLVPALLNDSDAGKDQ